MIDISKILYEITNNEEVLKPNCELLESGILDSYSIITLLGKLEDIGITIVPTRLNPDDFKTVESIQKLVDNMH